MGIEVVLIDPCPGCGRCRAGYCKPRWASITICWHVGRWATKKKKKKKVFDLDFQNKFTRMTSLELPWKHSYIHLAQYCKVDNASHQIRTAFKPELCIFLSSKKIGLRLKLDSDYYGPCVVLLPIALEKYRHLTEWGSSIRNDVALRVTAT